MWQWEHGCLRKLAIRRVYSHVGRQLRPVPPFPDATGSLATPASAIGRHLGFASRGTLLGATWQMVAWAQSAFGRVGLPTGIALDEIAIDRVAVLPGLSAGGVVTGTRLRRRGFASLAAACHERLSVQAPDSAMPEQATDHVGSAIAVSTRWNELADQ